MKEEKKNLEQTKSELEKVFFLCKENRQSEIFDSLDIQSVRNRLVQESTRFESEKRKLRTRLQHLEYLDLENQSWLSDLEKDLYTETKQYATIKTEKILKYVQLQNEEREHRVMENRIKKQMWENTLVDTHLKVCKNAIIQILDNDKQSLEKRKLILPVIGSLLHFTPNEMRRAQAAQSDCYLS